MINICIVIIMSILVGLASYYLMYQLNKWDKDISFCFNKSDTFLFIGFLVITGILLLSKNNGQLSSMLLYALILFWFLYLTAWIDFHTMQVYRMFSVIFCIIGLVLFILEKPSSEKIVGLALYCIIILFFTFEKFFGKGDSGIFIAVAFFLSCLSYQELTLTLLLIHNVLTTLIFVILNIKDLQIKKMKMKKRTALAPGITIATWIMTVYLF